MVAKYAYEFGKRWNVKTPRQDIKWLMSHIHVGTSDSEIERDLRSRCEGREGYTPSIIRQCVNYALLCHRENQELYRYVTRGLVR